VRRPPSTVVTAVLALSGMVAALNLTVAIPLVPVFPKLLGVSADDASWFVTVTLVAGAISIPAVTRLADMYGRRAMLIFCLVALTAGSLMSAIVSDYALLLIGRALAGFGMPLVPIGMSVLRDSLPPERVGQAVALMSATLGIGSALGLPMAGLLHDTLGWRSIFWVNGLIALILAILITTVVPRSRNATGGRFDAVGAVLLAATTASIMLLIANGAAWGWTSPVVLTFAAVAIVSLACWIALELKLREPLVDLRVSSSAPILLTNVSSFLVGFGLLINPILAMQQFQAPTQSGYGFGLTVLHASAFMVPGSVLLILMTRLNGWLLDTFGGRAVLIAGAVTMALGYGMRTVMWTTEWQLLIAVTVTSVGGGLAFAAMPTIIMKSVPSTMTAAANGLNALVRQLGTSSSSAAAAAALAAAPLVIGGIAYPGKTSILTLDILAACACVAAGFIASFVPRRL
jgi:MFS family permease